MPGTVRFELDDHVATITYDRPDALNAVNGELRRDLNNAFIRFRDDEDAWVAIVTDAGRAFCVGADLRDGAGSTGAFAGTFWEKPTINTAHEPAAQRGAAGTASPRSCDGIASPGRGRVQPRLTHAPHAEAAAWGAR